MLKRSTRALYRDLAFLFDANQSPNDLVTNATGTLSGSSPPTFGAATQPASTASAYTFNGNTTANRSYITYGTQSRTANLAKQATTWAFLLKINSAATSGGLAQRNDGNTVSAGWGIEAVQNAANSTLQFTMEKSVSNTQTRSQDIIVPNVWSTAVVTCNGDGTGAGVRMYINGMPTAVGVNVLGSGTQGNDAANSLEIGRSVYSSSFTQACDIATLLIADRQWNLDDVRLFHANSFWLYGRPRWGPRGFTVPTAAPWRFFLSPYPWE